MTDYTSLRKVVTGDIIIKCRLGKEIRRIPINQVPTYDELCLMMYRVFKNQIKAPENIVLKYKDDEGDMISLLDDVDITHAISISSLLKITVYDKSTMEQTLNSSSPNIQLQTSLVEMRDSLNDLINSFGKANSEYVSEKKKEDHEKPTRRLTAAELAKFSSDNTSDEIKKESTTTLPESSISKVPYYPPPTPQQQQPQQMQQSQLSLHPQPQQSLHPQPQQNLPPQPQQNLPPQPQQNLPPQPQSQQNLPPQSQPQQPQKQPYPLYNQPSTVGNAPPQQQQQQQVQRPFSLQPHPSHSSSYSNGTAPPQYSSSVNYQPAPVNNNSHSASNPSNDAYNRLQQQGYYVPPPPSSMSTPQLPPQPYNGPRW